MLMDPDTEREQKGGSKGWTQMDGISLGADLLSVCERENGILLLDDSLSWPYPRDKYSTKYKKKVVEFGKFTRKKMSSFELWVSHPFTKQFQLKSHKKYGKNVLKLRSWLRGLLVQRSLWKPREWKFPANFLCIIQNDDKKILASFIVYVAASLQWKNCSLALLQSSAKPSPRPSEFINISLKSAPWMIIASRVSA